MDRIHAALVALALSATGCIEGFHTPSAYQDQEYLCDDPHSADYQAAIAACRRSFAPCGGVFSMTGKLQSEPITVGTTATGAIYQVVQPQGSAEMLLDEAEIDGKSPYFFFAFRTKSVGRSIAAPDTTQRTLTINGGAPREANPLDDELIDVGLLVEVGGASADLHGFTGSGAVVIDYQSASELRGSFHGSFGAIDDVVQGCFDLFPLKTTIVPEPSQ